MNGMNEGPEVVLVNSFLWVREGADTGCLLFSGLVGSQLEYHSQRWESRVHGGDRAWDGTGKSDFVTWKMVEGTGLSLERRRGRLETSQHVEGLSYGRTIQSF